MGRFVRLLLLTLLALGIVVTPVLAAKGKSKAKPAVRSVYLKDGSVIQAQKVWREQGRVYVLVNRDTLVDLDPATVNLKRTFPAKAKRAKAPAAAVAKPAPAAAPAPGVGVQPPVVPPGQPSAAAKPAAPGQTPAAAPAAKPAVPGPPAAPPAAAKPTAPGPAPAAAPVAKPAAPVQTPAAATKPAMPVAPKVTPMAPEESPALGLGIVGVVLVFVLLMLVSMWKVYVKAGEPGWASLVPIYNLIVLARIGGKAWWWGLLVCLPFIGPIFYIFLCLGVASNFRRGVGFGLGLAFLGFIFFPILAFSKD